MIDHNLSQFSLNQDVCGEMVVPSETGNVVTQCNLRQFIVLTRRAYSANALTNLTDSEGIKLNVNNGNDCDIEDMAPFFYVKIVAKPQNSLSDFKSSQQANEFFEKILALAGRSNTRYKSGNRTAFLTSFEKEVHSDIGEVMVASLLIGTSVFYNDYRVTVNYPSVDVEYTEVLKDLFEGLNNTFPDIELEVNYETINNNKTFAQSLDNYF